MCQIGRYFVSFFKNITKWYILPVRTFFQIKGYSFLFIYCTLHGNTGRKNLPFFVFLKKLVRQLESIRQKFLSGRAVCKYGNLFQYFIFHILDHCCDSTAVDIYTQKQVFFSVDLKACGLSSRSRAGILHFYDQVLAE